LDENLQLALIRTLLATERNYLALERTQLSQLRTSQSLAVIAPSAAATLAYIFSRISEPFNFEFIAYLLLIIVTIYGVYTSLSAYKKLRKTRGIRRIIRKRELEVIEQGEFVKLYLKDILLLDKP
jgi:uncharacterized membrane protein YidH (DUF202 family)